MILVLMGVLGSIVLSLPLVQTYFAKLATTEINKQFGTNINIDRLQVSLVTWNAFLKGVYVEDHKNDTLFQIDRLRTSILNVRNLANGKLEFGGVDMERLNFKLKTYEGEEQSNLSVFIDKLDNKKTRDPGTPPFHLSSSDVTITDSHFRLINENKEKKKILDFRDLNIDVDNFGINGPDVSSDIREISFKSSKGIDVEKLTTAFKYTKEQMRFDSLDIKTIQSRLIGNLVFDYDREGLADFINKVHIDAEFVESTVALNEVNLMYDLFGSDKTVLFSSKINGVLNDLNTADMFLNMENTGIRGDFNFKNLFDPEADFSLAADMRNVTSSYYELRALLPNILGEVLPSSMQKLGQFTIRGDAVITESSIQTRSNINTQIGNSYVDLELTDIDQIDNASYEGFVALIDFDLGDLLESGEIGVTNLDFNVEGKGFVQENLNTEVIGEIYSLQFNGYDYKNLKVSGILKEQLFDGSLLSNDENIQFSFKGLADFAENRNNFNFIASVDFADLKKLNFIKDSVSIFKGDVYMDISGNSLDNLVGDLNFSKTNYQNKNDTYYFEDFKISSTFENDSTRIVDINSPDIITGYLKGNFKVKELGRLMQNSLGSIYTNYRPFQISKNQRVAFNFKIYNKIVDLFFPEVKFDPNTFIRGNIIADEGDFKLTFKSPSIVAYGNELDSIDVRIDNKNALFNTYISIGDLSTPYYDVTDFNLINTTLKDTLFFRTEFKGGSQFKDSYNLNFYHTFNQDKKSVIGLKTSDVNFKGNKWILNKEGNDKNKVILNKTLDSIVIEEIVMNHDDREQIRLRGQLGDSTYKDVELQFKIVSLDKITPTIDSLKLRGEVNGTLNILQKDNMYLPSSNLKISDFEVNKVVLGDLSLGIVGNKDLTSYVVNSSLIDKGKEKLSIVGNILDSKDDVPQANLIVDFNDFKLVPFSPLGDGVITNIRGFLNGSAQLKGPLGNPIMNGLLSLDKAGIAIPYLNVDYSFAPFSKVALTGRTFNFQKINLTDVAMNTKAILDGTITHNSFKDWSLDLDVDTNNNRFLILNTPFEEEVLYYGTGYLNGKGRIYGPTNALTIKVDGATAKGTSLKIPISDVASIGDFSFINFVGKKTGTTDIEHRVLKEVEGLELAFDLDVTPDAEVEIVVDTKTGSSLKGTGAGILFIEINTTGKFNMYGDFVVVTGEFHYKFGGFIDKTFRVRPGGNITWEREPLAAQLNMEAVYSLNANPAPLLDNPGYTRRIPTDVVVRLTGELESPVIDWRIDF
ncbi:MAG TPA: translocation/assembly module TamB domain-containing protein, partial [Arenibacter sp.]|nr:translocation/assembly module TamB domain-containing protein [Arenibacter sp.]